MRRLRGGRPRAEGERFACGKLKPPAPNPKVLAQRRMLAGQDGDLRRAEHPLELAAARGWIGEGQYRAGQAFARLYRQARLEAPDREARSQFDELETSDEDDNRRLGDLSRADLTAAFDRAFSQTAAPDLEGRSARAFDLWKRVNAGLAAAEQAEVFQVCVRGSWPQWIVQRAAGRTDTRTEARRRLLARGLDQVDQALFRRPAATSL